MYVVSGAKVAEFSTHDGSFVVMKVGNSEAGGGRQQNVSPRDRRGIVAADKRRRHASYNGGAPNVQQREYANQAWDARSARFPAHSARGRGGPALPQVRVSLTDQQRSSSGSGTALSLSPFWIEVGPTSSPSSGGSAEKLSKLEAPPSGLLSPTASRQRQTDGKGGYLAS